MCIHSHPPSICLCWNSWLIQAFLVWGWGCFCILNKVGHYTKLKSKEEWYLKQRGWISDLMFCIGFLACGCPRVLHSQASSPALKRECGIVSSMIRMNMPAFFKRCLTGYLFRIFSPWCVSCNFCFKYTILWRFSRLFRTKLWAPQFKFSVWPSFEWDAGLANLARSLPTLMILWLCFLWFRMRNSWLIPNTF